MDTTNLTDEELVALSGSTTDELRRRGLASPGAIRLGDLAEAIVVERLGLRRAPKSTAGYDAVADDGTRYQIKARRLGTAGDRQLGVIRNIDRRAFHFLVVVLFPPESDVPEGMWQIPFDVVREKARPNKHQNGHILLATDAVLADERVERLFEPPMPRLLTRPPSARGRRSGDSGGGRFGGTEGMEGFRSWIADHKRYAPNVVASQLPRCRRVERELTIFLDASVGTEAGLADVIDRINNEILTDASAKSQREGRASLIFATRRYAEFLTWQTEADPIRALSEA